MSITKIHNSDRNKKPKGCFIFKDLKSTYQLLKKDSSSILKYLTIKGYSFRIEGKAFRCKEKGSLIIKKLNNGVWALHDNSQNTIQDLEILILNETKHLEGKDRTEAQIKAIEQLNEVAIQEIVKTTTNTPLDTEKTKFDFTFDNWEIQRNKYPLTLICKKTGANLPLLKKLGVKLVKNYKKPNSDRLPFDFSRNNRNYAIAYTTKENGLVCKTFIRKKKGYISQKEEGYCFGLDSLPKQGVKKIIFCEGENDKIAIDAACNRWGVYALTCGGVTSSIPTDTINYLKETYKVDIYILFDNDKAGIENAPKLATQHQLINCTGFYEEVNCSEHEDICDIHQAGVDLYKFIDKITWLAKSNSLKSPEIDIDNSSFDVQKTYPFNFESFNIKRSIDDPFSIHVQNALKLDFKQYLGELTPNENGIKPIDYIMRAMCVYNRLLMNSPAGTGKSYLTILLCMTGNRLMEFIQKQLACKTFIFTAPTKAICEQMYWKFRNFKDENGGNIFKSKDVCLIIGGENKTYGTINEGKIIIVTYDSLFNDGLKQLIKESLLVIDEGHQQVNDKDYRREAMRIMFQASMIAKRVLQMTATPNLLFTSRLHEGFKYKLIQCFPKITNRIDLTIWKHKCAKKALFHHIEENSPQSGVIVVKMDNVKVLEEFRCMLKDRGISCDLFSSKEAKYSCLNENYKSVMRTGKLKNPVKFLLVTTFAEAGISFDFEVGAIHLIDTKSADRIIQFSNRPRLQKNGVNSLVKVHLYFTAKKNKKQQETTLESLEKTFNSRIKGAESLADILNDRENPCIEDYELNGQKILSVYRDQETKKFKKDITGIMSTIHRTEISLETIESLSKKIKARDNRFTIRTRDDHDKSTGELEARLKGAKASEQEKYSNLINLIQKDPVAYLRGRISIIKNPNQKEDLKNTFKLPPTNKEQGREIVQCNELAYASKHNSDITKSLLFLAKNGFSAKESFGIVLNNDISTLKKYRKSKTRFIQLAEGQRIAKSLKSKGEYQSKFHEKDQLDGLFYRFLIKHFSKACDNVKQGNRKDTFKPEQLAKYMDKSMDSLKKFLKANSGSSDKQKLFKSIDFYTSRNTTEKATIDIMKTFWDLERTTDRTGGKKTNVYRLNDSQQKQAEKELILSKKTRIDKNS